MRHINILLRHINILVRHINILVRHINILVRHINILVRHINILVRHINISSFNRLSTFALIFFFFITILSSIWLKMANSMWLYFALVTNECFCYSYPRFVRHERTGEKRRCAGGVEGQTYSYFCGEFVNKTSSFLCILSFTVHPSSYFKIYFIVKNNSVEKFRNVLLCCT